jgi:hypothetical protein
MRIHDGLVASFAITPQGDATAHRVTIDCVNRGALRPWRIIEPSTA